MQVQNLRNVLVAGMTVAGLTTLIPVFQTDARSPQAGKIGAHLGYAKAAEAENGNGLIGGHLELMMAPFLGVVGSVDYRLVESFDIDAGGVNGSFDVRSIPVTVEGRVYVPGATVSPFVGVGAGWYFIRYDYSDDLENLGFRDDTENSFGWHVAAGTELGLGPKVSLFGEARAVFLDSDHSLNTETTQQVKEFDYDSTYFSVGVNFKF